MDHVIRVFLFFKGLPRTRFSNLCIRISQRFIRAWIPPPRLLPYCCCCCVTSVVSDSVQQPTRLPCPRDSLGKNTGMGCHFLLQCMKVKRESEVAQSCPTLSDPMDCSAPGSSVHGVFQTRVLDWVPLPSPLLPYRVSNSEGLDWSLRICIS